MLTGRGIRCCAAANDRRRTLPAQPKVSQSRGSETANPGVLHVPVGNVTSGPDGTFIASTEVATASSENGLGVIPINVSGSSASFQNGMQDLSRVGSAATLGALVSGTFTNPDANNRGTVSITSGTLAGSGSAAYYIASNTEAMVLGTDAANSEPQILLLTNSLPVNR